MCDPKDVRAWNIRATVVAGVTAHSEAVSQTDRETEWEWTGIWDTAGRCLRWCLSEHNEGNCGRCFWCLFECQGVAAGFCLLYVFCFVFVVLLNLSLFLSLLLLSAIENRTFFAAFFYHWKYSRIWTGDSGYACMITGLAHWLRSSPTLPCVLLAIMPKIWLTSRLLLFIMIHFARFYGCPAPTAVAQWSLQAKAGVNSPLCPLSMINFMRFDHILFHSVSLIRLSCGPL